MSWKNVYYDKGGEENSVMNRVFIAKDKKSGVELGAYSGQMKWDKHPEVAPKLAKLSKDFLTKAVWDVVGMMGALRDMNASFLKEPGALKDLVNAYTKILPSAEAIGIADIIIMAADKGLDYVELVKMFKEQKDAPKEGDYKKYSSGQQTVLWFLGFGECVYTSKKNEPKKFSPKKWAKELFHIAECNFEHLRGAGGDQVGLFQSIIKQPNSSKVSKVNLDHMLHYVEWSRPLLYGLSQKKDEKLEWSAIKGFDKK